VTSWNTKPRRVRSDDKIAWRRNCHSRPTPAIQDIARARLCHLVKKLNSLGEGPLDYSVRDVERIFAIDLSGLLEEYGSIASPELIGLIKAMAAIGSCLRYRGTAPMMILLTGALHRDST
jgi:hypothetical protein